MRLGRLEYILILYRYMGLGRLEYILILFRYID